MTARKLSPVRLGLFVLLSVGDLFLTWYLLRGEDSAAYEANPLARFWLDHFGWVGLAAFKACMVLLVGALVWVVASFKPGTANRFLAFACGIVGVILVYSTALTFVSGNKPSDQEVARRLEQERKLVLSLEATKEYQASLDELGEDLAAGRRTLKEAVNVLADTRKAQDPKWLRILHWHFPGRSSTECLGAHLVSYTLATAPNDPATQPLARRLRAEFRATFGDDIPPLPSSPQMAQGQPTPPSIQASGHSAA